ncbi:nucleoside triphosphate pyrophosphohydrolase [Psychrosphaera haliotis]|uniref:Nucleoside triphosphate pyrophosphohydrolase n=2 Tax=Psychrosphaera haliotis TaxID=555083 RepID=A0A6N8FE43_9GAMM|nr:nucleoside triphosphate pyrophosphohydrolase [Psychrosphaera haliotis]
MNTDKPAIDKLIWIMSQLRDPNGGCPWDLKQSFKTIVPHTLEEAYEVAEAIEQEDFEELPKELGDLLFQVVFYAQLGKEQELFDFEKIASLMCEKLIRRHPHVFGELSNQTLNDSEIKYNWEQIKTQERNANSKQSKTSVLDDIPNALPALNRAYKIQKRVAHVGFDWPDVNGALDKVEEEIAELRVEIEKNKEKNNSNTNKERIADELGDLFFALTNVSRHLGLNPEQITRQANDKFSRRFKGVEQLAEEHSTPLSDMSLDEMEELWLRVKASEPKS